MESKKNEDEPMVDPKINKVMKNQQGCLDESKSVEIKKEPGLDENETVTSMQESKVADVANVNIKKEPGMKENDTVTIERELKVADFATVKIKKEPGMNENDTVTTERELKVADFANVKIKKEPGMRENESDTVAVKRESKDADFASVKIKKKENETVAVEREINESDFANVNIKNEPGFSGNETVPAKVEFSLDELIKIRIQRGLRRHETKLGSVDRKLPFVKFEPIFMASRNGPVKIEPGKMGFGMGHIRSPADLIPDDCDFLLMDIGVDEDLLYNKAHEVFTRKPHVSILQRELNYLKRKPKTTLNKDPKKPKIAEEDKSVGENKSVEVNKSVEEINSVKDNNKNVEEDEYVEEKKHVDENKSVKEENFEDDIDDMNDENLSTCLECGQDLPPELNKGVRVRCSKCKFFEDTYNRARWAYLMALLHFLGAHDPYDDVIRDVEELRSARLERARQDREAHKARSN